MADLNLSRRAVAAGWEWQAGALAINAGGPVRIDGCDSFNEPFVWGKCQWSGERVELWVREMPLPDFNDPATRGCLLDQVRRRWGKQVYAVPICDAETITRWLAIVPDPATDAWEWPGFEGADEVSALLAALEAAPKR